jgi:hypothetical protein
MEPVARLREPPAEISRFEARLERYPGCLEGRLRRGRLGRSDIVVADGPLAQLVAHLHDAQGVVGSSPARPTQKLQVRRLALGLSVVLIPPVL